MKSTEYFDAFSPVLPKQGCLLLSEPFLADKNFARTVVLICEHSEKGSMGYVLNRPSKYTLSSAIDHPVAKTIPLYVGGPVSRNTLHMLHRVRPMAEESVEIMPGLWWGGDFRRILKGVEEGVVKPEEVRFFIGYSGWSEDQLNREITKLSWIVNKEVKMRHIFSTQDEALWRNILKDMGGKFKSFSHFPEDPSLN